MLGFTEPTKMSMNIEVRGKDTLILAESVRLFHNSVMVMREALKDKKLTTLPLYKAV